MIDTLHEVFATRLSEAGFACVDASIWTKEEIMNQLHEYEGLALRSRFKISREEIDAAAKLKFIARAGAGLENIDTQYATSKNIVCFNSPEGNRDSVAEHALGMLLMLLHKLNIAHAEVQHNIWNRKSNWGNELGDKTMALIGFGNMGSAFAKKLQSLGCKIIAYDPYITIDNNLFPFVTQVEMGEVFEHADIVSLHTPLTAETTHLINYDYILRFAKPIVLINTARGKNVDTDALAKGIESGKVAGACLDVLEFEPVTFEQMNFDQLPPSFKYLQSHPQVIITPHIAGWTHQSNFKIADVLATKIINHFSIK
ncbi:MAG: hydroxyacid dehydrogenase [Bacteroidetes bacterium]|nr:hydroxyacid dehydrogenase [Bacteroidota bacterium]